MPKPSREIGKSYPCTKCGELVLFLEYRRGQSRLCVPCARKRSNASTKATYWRRKGGVRINRVKFSPVTKAFILANVILNPITRCWIWQRGKDLKTGYGRARDYGKQIRIHRKAYELWFGPLARHLHACHKCDTPSCCNPWHLFPGTTLENYLDSFNKGRARYSWKWLFKEKLRV